MEENEGGPGCLCFHRWQFEQNFIHRGNPIFRISISWLSMVQVTQCNQTISQKLTNSFGDGAIVEDQCWSVQLVPRDGHIQAEPMNSVHPCCHDCLVQEPNG